jgi:hypothetical protein
MAASGIPQVTSWTSLTRLAEQNCLLCSEGTGEKGEHLLESKDLVTCSCSFMVHRSCWTDHLQKSGQKLCPGCEKSMIPLHLIEAALAVKEENGEDSKSAGGLSGWNLALLILCILLVIAFAIGMTVGIRRA